MMDILISAQRAVAWHSMLAVPLVFTTGALSSVGPCAAPRLLAAISCVGASPRRARLILAAFLGGLIASYASFGAVVSIIGRLIDISSWTYGIVAASLGIGGIITLLRMDAHSTCASTRQTRPGPTSLGGVFLLGASFSLVISPCCTPLVTMVVAYTAQSNDPLYGSSLLALFALGHGLPVLAAGLSTANMMDRLQRTLTDHVMNVMSGTIMIVLSVFYWCLV